MAPNNDKPDEKAKSDNLVDCIIMRDFWDDKGERHRKGGKVRVPFEMAMDGVESGALTRAK